MVGKLIANNEKGLINTHSMMVESTLILADEYIQLSMIESKEETRDVYRKY